MLHLSHHSSSIMITHALMLRQVHYPISLTHGPLREIKWNRIDIHGRIRVAYCAKIIFSNVSERKLLE